VGHAVWYWGFKERGDLHAVIVASMRYSQPCSEDNDRAQGRPDKRKDRHWRLWVNARPYRKVLAFGWSKMPTGQIT